MKYTLEAEKLNSVTISHFITELKKVEENRDLKESARIFSEIWENIDVEPDFSEYEISQQAELYRLGGYFLSSYGKTKNLPLYQERAKNLLSKAIRLFTELNEPVKVSEAKGWLASCYLFEGAINEFESIVEEARSEFQGSHLHPVYLQIRTSAILALLHKREYHSILEIIEELTIPMEFCGNIRLRSLFHEKAGLFFKNTGQFETAVSHQKQSIKFATEANNINYLCQMVNNLANTYNKMGEYGLAYQNINKALRIAYENDYLGWIPVILDTKATIYANDGHLEIALETINEAISILRKGEDAHCLTEAIWNKCKFLLGLDRKEEAITLFGELIPIASQQMGEYAVKIFVKEFAKIIHIKQSGSFEDEVRRFKRVEIVNAIREANYNLNEAAESLKINLNLMTKIIDKEFPELYQELDILQKSNFKDELDDSYEQNKVTAPRNISELSLNETEIVFETETLLNFQTFYFSAEKMLESFRISHDAVVAILPIQQLTADEFVLVEDVAKNIYSFGKVNYDKALNLYFFVSEDEPMPITFDEVKLIGKAIAYCPFAEVDNDKLVFQNFGF